MAKIRILDSVGIDTLCDLIADGHTQRDIAALYSVSRSTVAEYLTAHSEQYARAREARGDLYFDKIQDIAENIEGDPQRDRLRIDALKWQSSKLNPRNYGDKLTQDIEIKGNITFDEFLWQKAPD